MHLLSLTLTFCLCYVCLCFYVWGKVKYAKLKEDWTVILELVRQHKERMANLLVAKKASKTQFSSVGVCGECRKLYFSSLTLTTQLWKI